MLRLRLLRFVSLMFADLLQRDAGDDDGSGHCGNASYEIKHDFLPLKDGAHLMSMMYYRSYFNYDFIYCRLPRTRLG